MIRSLHLLLGFEVVAPFLLQGKPRSLAALPSIAALSNPRGLSSTLPIARSSYGACSRAFRMSSGDSETSPAADVGSGPAVAPPVVSSVDFPRPTVWKESDLWSFYCGFLIPSSLMDRCRVSTSRNLGSTNWWDLFLFIENLDSWIIDRKNWNKEKMDEVLVKFCGEVHKPKVRFCQACGNPTKQTIPDGEEKIRAVCTVCGRIHYENPKMVVGCLVEHDDKVLLCKRKIEPSYGLWTLPAGYLEIGESAAEGACRETLEEACAEVEILSPFAQLDIPRIGQYRVTSYSEQA